VDNYFFILQAKLHIKKEKANTTLSIRRCIQARAEQRKT